MRELRVKLFEIEVRTTLSHLSSAGLNNWYTNSISGETSITGRFGIHPVSGGGSWEIELSWSRASKSVAMKNVEGLPALLWTFWVDERVFGDQEMYNKKLRF
jgi:hypothetical protein